MIGDIKMTGSVLNSSRVCVNTGLVPAKDSNLYFENSILPKADFNPISKQEFEKNYLAESQKEDRNYLISLQELPNYLCDLFDRLNLAEAKTRPEMVRMFQDKVETVNKINLALEEVIRMYTIEDFDLHGLSFTEPGRITSSAFFSDATGKQMKLLGLHLDRGGEVPLKEKDFQSRNRIGINLGAEPRTLYFIGHSIVSMYNRLMEAGVSDLEVNNRNIEVLFMATFPDIPVYAIKQEPYEFYIAPTDNLIHDGTTFGRKSFDILMSFLGKFEHESNSINKIIVK